MMGSSLLLESLIHSFIQIDIFYVPCRLRNGGVGLLASRVILGVLYKLTNFKCVSEFTTEFDKRQSSIPAASCNLLPVTFSLIPTAPQ